VKQSETNFTIIYNKLLMHNFKAKTYYIYTICM